MMNYKSHLNQHCGHSSTVALNHYENHNNYHEATPANLLQCSTDSKIATQIMWNRVIKAAIDDPDVFLHEFVTQKLNDLPFPEDSLDAHCSKKFDPDLNWNVNPPLWPCYVNICPFKCI